MSETDPDLPIDKEAVNFVILAAINPADKKPYPLKVDPATGLVVNTEMGPITLGAITIKDNTSAEQASVGNSFLYSNPEKLGLFTFPMYADPNDPLNNEPMPLPFEGNGVQPSMTSMVLRPFNSSLAAPRGIGVGINAARHEGFLVDIGTQVDPGEQYVQTLIPAHKARRMVGYLTHDVQAGTEGVVLEIQFYNIFYSNGAVIYVANSHQIILDEWNQEGVFIDLDCVADWARIYITNPISNTQFINFHMHNLTGEVN